MGLGNGERYYSPGLGRFIQQDSWPGKTAMPASLNRYAYAYDSPLRYTDPSGHEPFTIAGLLLIAFLSVVAINTVRQDMEVRSGQRRVEDFSLSEAAVNGTVIGNGYSAVTGMDAVTSRQLSGAERALAGVEVGLEFVSVGGSALRATTQSARVARAANVAVNAAQTAQAGIGVYRGGSATAEMLREGRYGAAALTGLLTAASGAGGYQSAKALRGEVGALARRAGDALDRAATHWEEAAERAIANGRQSELGALRGGSRDAADIADEISVPRPPSLLDEIVDEANLVAAEGGAITAAQRTQLRENLPVVQRRSVAANKMARKEFVRNESRLTSQWERNTGRVWPEGATPHHIIPLESGGANKWWNLVPTNGRLPNHALDGIPGPHAQGGVLRRTIQRSRRQLPPGSLTDLRELE